MKEVVVLAAGLSKRMRPFELKPTIRIAGKTIIDRILESWKGYRIYIIYRDERIKDYIKTEGIKFIEQIDDMPGTAGAIYSAKDHVKGESFFVISADHVLDPEIFRKIQSSEPDTIVVKRVNNPEKYGVVMLNNNRVVDIVEKPTNPKTNLVNIGIYHFSKRIFNQISKIEMSTRGEYEITDVLIDKNAIVVDNEFWMDVAYPWELLEATKYILSREPERNHGELIGHNTIIGKVIIEENAQIINSTIEGPVYIGKNVKIGPYSYIRGPASIEEDSEIGVGTTVKNSLVMQGTKAKHLNYIGDSVIGKHVNLGAGSVIANLRFDEKNILPMNTRKFGAVIGDNCKTGVNSMIMPGSIIPSNTIIYPGQIYKNDQ
ncbi:MAG: sugar phosphate nucleotidyltransferase [Candidatus Micrarchaeota archaeon]|nr:sugar phosphate nucleotidyltransferase [Candidatus Micrarchaeota archaeon]MCX8154460.1 sugar phosphate nucleotidyltransferase [Candidatus Micrarchaeota archaeon]